MALNLNPITLGKNLLSTGYNAVKSIPGRILGLMGATRNAIQRRVMSTSAHKATGPLIDRMTLPPTASVVSELLGAGSIEEAEGKIAVGVRKKIRKAAEALKEVAREGSMSEDEFILFYDKKLSREHKIELERILPLKVDAQTPDMRRFLRAMTQAINRERKGQPLQLLSSAHKLTTLADKLALHMYQSKSKDITTPLEVLRYPPVVRGRDAGQFQKNKPGAAWKSLISKKPRFDATWRERREAVGPPKLSKDGSQYKVALNEPYKFMAQSRKQFEKRKRFSSTFLSLSVSLGEKGYPKNGDPSQLYEAFRQKYQKELQFADMNQIAFGMHQSGNKIVLVGLLTNNRVATPETLPEEALPSRYDDAYWYKHIPEADRTEGSQFAQLLNSEHFPASQWDPDDESQHLPPGYKGYMVWNTYRIYKAVQNLKQQHYNIDLTGIALREREVVLGQPSPCIHLSIRTNGKAETFKLAYDVLETPDEYAIAKAGKKDPLLNAQSGLRVDQFLDKLEDFASGGELEKNLQQISGQQAPPAVAVPPPPQDFDV